MCVWWTNENHRAGWPLTELHSTQSTRGHQSKRKWKCELIFIIIYSFSAFLPYRDEHLCFTIYLSHMILWLLPGQAAHTAIVTVQINKVAVSDFKIDCTSSQKPQNFTEAENSLQSLYAVLGSRRIYGSTLGWSFLEDIKTESQFFHISKRNIFPILQNLPKTYTQ